jgi:hypothetical protein
MMGNSQIAHALNDVRAPCRFGIKKAKNGCRNHAYHS